DALQRRDVAPGAHVALLLDNGRDCLLAYFAVVRSGAVPVPFHPRLVGDALAALLVHCDAVAVIAEAGSAPAVDAVRPELPARLYVVAAPDGTAADWTAAGTDGSAAPAPDGWDCLVALAREPGHAEPVRADAE